MAILKECVEFTVKAALNFKLFEQNELNLIKTLKIASFLNLADEHRIQQNFRLPRFFCFVFSAMEKMKELIRRFNSFCYCKNSVTPTTRSLSFSYEKSDYGLIYKKNLT
jgi:hypothetical protein